jgi:isocitrate dehydrogenase (NAD+)
MTHRVTVLQGDGIGPEIIASAVDVVSVVTRNSIEFDWENIGERAFQITGELLPKKTLASIENNKVAIKGPTATPQGEGHRSLNVQLRETFDLYAGVRPVRSISGVKTRFSDVPIDIIVFRENLEDLYVGEEKMVNGVAEAISRFTRGECERIARYAFEYAKRKGRSKVTVVGKTNILKLTHGLFAEVAKGIASRYPSIEHEYMNSDNCLAQLVLNPQRFDCILAPNFLGDHISEVCAALVGGVGLAPGANIGFDYAIFEAIHGTAPNIAGQGIANPTSIILSAAMMLDHLQMKKEADRIRAAVYRVLAEGKTVTKDVNPVSGVSTQTFTTAIIEIL